MFSRLLPLKQFSFLFFYNDCFSLPSFNFIKANLDGTENLVSAQLYWNAFLCSTTLLTVLPYLTRLQL